jgi:peptidoglycan hydrolase FlgJ
MSDSLFDKPVSFPNSSYLADSGKIQTLQQAQGKSRGESKLKVACQQFESLFLSMMLKEMRETIPKSELFGAGQAEEIYTSLLDTQLSHELAQKGGIGLATIIEKYLSNQPDEEASLPERAETKK